MMFAGIFGVVKALFEALENIKGELMVLCFISLLLTFFQAHIAKICIPKGASKLMLPCSYRGSPKEDTKGKDATEEHRRRLLWNDGKLLAGAAPASCQKEHIDYDVVKSANPDFKKATVRLNIYKQHRQTIQVL